jgi:arylsulfatase A-like enzyme
MKPVSSATSPCLLFAAFASLFFVAQPVAAVDRPNILWMTCEDMSPRLGCYGDSVAQTPHIDRLASEGIRFTRAFATYPVCAPSRHSIITGMYPVSTGAMHMRTHMRPEGFEEIADPEIQAIPLYEATPPAGVVCFTEYLRAAGYFCTNNAKTDYQFQTPFTAWDESNRLAHWRSRPDPDMPFFAVFNFEDTHESRLFEESSPSVTDPADVVVPAYFPDVPIVRQHIARQYDNIHKMDARVGEILAQLEADGLADSTIVFFYSDHGDGMIRSKRWVYDSGTRVPLIVRFPDGSYAGEISNELVSLIDLSPTMLSLVGLAVPEYMQGQAFLGPLRGEPRDYVYLCRDRMDTAFDTIRAVRDERFMYVRHYRPELPYVDNVPYRDRSELAREIQRMAGDGELGPDQWQFTSHHKPLEELYDCEADLDQVHNLASDPVHFDKLAELRSAHEAWTEATGDLGYISEDELVRRLWPPDGEQPTTVNPMVTIANGQMTIDTATEGASIAYRVGETGRWQLYSRPVAVPSGETISTQSIRLGWKPSAVVNAVVP